MTLLYVREGLRKRPISDTLPTGRDSTFPPPWNNFRRQNKRASKDAISQDSIKTKVIIIQYKYTVQTYIILLQ